MRAHWIWSLSFVLVACGANVYRDQESKTTLVATSNQVTTNNSGTGTGTGTGEGQGSGATSGPFRLLSAYSLRLAPSGASQVYCVQPQTSVEYQGWKFVDAGGGKVFIKNTYNNDMFCLSAAGNFAMVGGCNNTTNALWIKEQVNMGQGSSNYFRFRTSQNGPCLKAVGFTAEVKLEAANCSDNDSVWQAAPY